MVIYKIGKHAYYKDAEHNILWQRSVFVLQNYAVIVFIVIICAPDRNEAALRCCV